VTSSTIGPKGSSPKSNTPRAQLARLIALATGCDDRKTFERIGGGRYMEAAAAAVLSVGSLNDYRPIIDKATGRHVGHEITVNEETEGGETISQTISLDLRRWDLVADGAAAPFKTALQATNKSLTGLMRLYEAAIVRSLEGSSVWLAEAFSDQGFDLKDTPPEVNRRVAGWIAHGLIKSALENTIPAHRRAHYRVVMEFSPGVREWMSIMLSQDIETDVMRDWAIAAPLAAALKRNLWRKMATTTPTYPMKDFLKAARLSKAVGIFKPGTCGTVQRAMGMTGLAGQKFELSNLDGGFFSQTISTSAPDSLHQQRLYLAILIRIWERQGLKFAETNAGLIGQACQSWRRGKISPGESQYIADFICAEDEMIAASKLKRPGKGATLKSLLQLAKDYAAYERALEAKNNSFKLPADMPDDGSLAGTRARLIRIKNSVELYDAWAIYQNCCRDYVSECKTGRSSIYLIAYPTTGDELRHVAMLELRRTGNGLIKKAQLFAPYNAPPPQHIDRACARMVDGINADIIERHKHQSQKSAA